MVRRWALGVVTVWPLLFLPTAAIVGGADSPTWLKATTLATVVLSFGLVIAYGVHAYRNPAVSEDGKVLWIVVLAILSLAATPVYWWRYLRCGWAGGGWRVAGPRARTAPRSVATARRRSEHRPPRTAHPPYGSISTPGFRIPAGSTSRFAARSASANGSGRCRSYQGRWSRPDRVVVRDRAAARFYRLAGGRLDDVPLLDLGAAARRRQAR